MNIFRGSASVEEVSKFIGGRPIIVAYAKDQDGALGTYYDFGNSIVHPETGKKLYPVKGYCDPKNTYTCYYAEFRDDTGRSYHYLDARYYYDPNFKGTSSIADQIREDEAEWRRRNGLNDSDGNGPDKSGPNAKQRAILDSADEPAQSWETGTPNAKQRAILDSADGPAQNWETGTPNAKQRAILDGENSASGQSRGGERQGEDRNGSARNPYNGNYNGR